MNNQKKYKINISENYKNWIKIKKIYQNKQMKNYNKPNLNKKNKNQKILNKHVKTKFQKKNMK